MAGTYFQRMIFILFLSCLFPAGIGATPIGSASFTFSYVDPLPIAIIVTGQSFALSLSDYDIEHGIDRPDGVDSGPSYVQSFEKIFSSFLTLTSIGSTFSINQSNYAFWDNMVDYVLTDGDQDHIAFSFGMLDGFQNCNWDFTSDYAGNGIDFQGYSIDNLILTIDSIQGQPAPLDSEHRLWTTSFTLAVDGQSAPIPEPATMLLFFIGIVGLVGTRSRKKNEDIQV